jgi:hypothetical protein
MRMRCSVAAAASSTREPEDEGVETEVAPPGDALVGLGV